MQYHQDLKAGKSAAVRRLQQAARQAEVRADSAEEMSHELHWQLQVCAAAIVQSFPVG